MNGAVKAPIVADGGSSCLTSRQSTSTPIVAYAVTGMCEAVPPPNDRPPCFEPIGGTRLLENLADIMIIITIDEKCLRVLGKGQDHNIFHSDNLLVKRIVLLLAGIDSFEIFHMVIAGGGNTWSKRKSDHVRK